MIEAARIAEILAVRANTVQDLSRKVEKGLGKRSLVRVARRVAARGDEADRLMYRVVARSTFERRLRLNQHESELTERPAKVIASAEYAWDDRQGCARLASSAASGIGWRTRRSSGRGGAGQDPLWAPGLNATVPASCSRTAAGNV